MLWVTKAGARPTIVQSTASKPVNWAAIECIFGYGKQHGTLRKTMHRGIASVNADFLLSLIAYNLCGFQN